jgi:dTDP-4-amino-4,6-dideoxy-D-glucose acyltransferase
MGNHGGRCLNENELTSLGFGQIGKNVRIHERASIYGTENIFLGDDIRIDDFVVIIATGSLRVGSRCSIHNFCFFGAKKGITIGDDCTFAPGVKVFSSNDDYLSDSGHGVFVDSAKEKRIEAPVLISNSTLVGAGSVILPGVQIGQAVSIAALSLVKNDIESRQLMAGIPEKAIKVK